MDQNLLTDLLHTLDAPQFRYRELETRYTNRPPLAFLSPEAKVALGNRLPLIAANFPRLAVSSLAERLRITGFTGADVWHAWTANDMPQRSSITHRESLLFGQSFVSVWAGAGGSSSAGQPLISVESPKQVATIMDPGTRVVTSAVKRWHTKSTTECIVYLPDQIIFLRANTPGATTAGFEVVGELDNPLGVVPMVPIRNSDLLAVWQPYEVGATDRGVSEIHDLLVLCDGLNKTLADLAVAQEYTARPRRWATGIELVQTPELDSDGNPVLDGDGNPVMVTGNPIPEGNRAMISENDAAKFGQLAGADLAGFQTSVDIWLQMIMAVSALPAHMCGVVTANPATSVAQDSAEGALTARAEARQQVFARGWEQVAKLIVAVRDGADPADVDCQVQWAPPDTQSDAQSQARAGDSAQKLYQAGILSRATTLKRLGFTDDEVAQEQQNFAAESTGPSPDTTDPTNVA